VNLDTGLVQEHVSEMERRSRAFDVYPAGFRQGTEPSVHIPEGFKQGSEPFFHIPNGFRQGTEPILTIPKGFRQGTEPSSSRTQTVACKGEIINGNCYEFNPTPLAFLDAQVRPSSISLASVTSVDLHPVLTWLGATIKKQQASWLDGSEWSYSDWMPGHPNVHTDNLSVWRYESWWTAADCELKRASICPAAEPLIQGRMDPCFHVFYAKF
uniref:C-type lectin domain-containing protein n=1 Tax=Amphiprion percula TaxID=161767 RepID=A0A3P8T9W3_AMPPE